MRLAHLASDAPLTAYEEQATVLFAAWHAADGDAVKLFWHKHPRFLDPLVPWKPKTMLEAEVRATKVDPDDARLAIARWYDFQDWSRLAEFVAAATNVRSPVARFERAVDAVVAGDTVRLAAAIAADAALVHARSTRITHFDPAVHGATLLHYVAANGVEGYRQRTPANAVEVARTLLEAGAETDALAHLYGGQCTTMSLLVSSAHPADAGLQVALVDVLVEFGAAVEARGTGAWASPVMTALAFGYRDAADALVRHGARVDTLPAAAALGRADDARRLLMWADADDRHRALVLAAQHGHAEIVAVLLDAGEDPNRYNPKGTHAHSTPLHQAALAGHESVVRLLVERGARLDIPDTIWQGTPLGWATHGGRVIVADFLRSKGAPGE